MKLEMFDLINEKIFINGEKVKINDYLKDITKYYNEILSNDSKVNMAITFDKERIGSISCASAPFIIHCGTAYSSSPAISISLLSR